MKMGRFLLIGIILLIWAVGLLDAYIVYRVGNVL